MRRLIKSELFQLCKSESYKSLFIICCVTALRNCREIICIFLESMLIYVMNEFSDSGGHFHGT